MIDFLVALSGGIGIGAAALAVCYGYHADTCRALGYEDEASKYYKFFGICIGYILLWLAAAVIVPEIFCK